MSALGIYFGSYVVRIVETKGKKILNDIQIPFSKALEADLEEKVPDEVKMAALLKDELARNRITAKEVNLALSGKDLIIRTFEIPPLPRNELASVVNFEAKKYIPFKVEELILANQVIFDRSTRKNLVLLVGIKKETLDKYATVFQQLKLEISSIEYSTFSILRLLRLCKLNSKGIVGLVGVDLQGEDEISFVVSENGFPLFSRDITLTGGPGEPVDSKEPEPGMMLEKLKTEIRISLDYYHRKFPTKRIAKMFFVSTRDCRLDLEAFFKEMGLAAHYVDVGKCIDKPIAYSLTFIKGYSSSLAKAIKTNLKIDLLAARQEPKAIREVPTAMDLGSLISGVRMDSRVVILALSICIGVFLFGLYRRTPLEKELNNVISVRPQVSTVNPEAVYEDLALKDSEYTTKIDVLNKLFKKQLYLTPVLDAIPRLISKGVWLENLSFVKGEDQKAELKLEGLAYLADSNKEFELVNSFLSKLKEDRVFGNYFKDINIASLDTVQMDKTTLTKFVVFCRSEYKE
jgi:hypothetical protein